MAEDHLFSRSLRGQNHSPSHSSLLPEPNPRPYSSTTPPSLESFTTNQQILLASILRELQDANTLNQKLAAAPPNKYDFIWTLLLQTFAITTGIVFGVFAILAWISSTHSNNLASQSLTAAQSANSMANEANSLGSSANALAVQASLSQYDVGVTASYQADAANRMALVAYCANIPSTSTSAHKLCNSVTSAAMANLNSIVYSLFPTLSPPPTSSAAPPPPAPTSFTASVTQTSTGEPESPSTAPTANISSTSSSNPNEPTATQGSSSNSDLAAAPRRANVGKIASITIGVLSGLIMLVTLWFLLYRSFQAKERQAKAFTRDSKFAGSEVSFQQQQQSRAGKGRGLGVQMREMKGGRMGQSQGNGGGMYLPAESQEPLVT